MTDKDDFLKKVKVVSDDEAEQCDYLVCARAAGHVSPFTDNFYGVCCECGESVIYRWHAPRKPKRICLQCVATHKDFKK
jgi:hypothetical protein